MDQQTAPNTDSTVQTTAGFQLDLSKSKPQVAEFIDWDQQFLSRGYMPPEEANVHGTPATWMGKSTGFGKHAQQKVGPGAAPAPQPAAPAAVQHGPQMPGQAPHSVEQPQPAAPHLTQPAAPAVDGRNPMPFAMQLFPMMGQMGHPLGVAAGYGGQPPAPAHVQPPAPAAPFAPIAKSAAAPGAGWIDWSGFEAHMAAMMGGQPPEDPVDEGPAAEPKGPAESTTTTTPMGRGTGGTLTYKQPAEKSFVTPMDALDHLMKGVLAIAQAPLEKAGGHKYKSRKKVGGRWVYDYGEKKGGQQGGLFGPDVMDRPKKQVPAGPGPAAAPKKPAKPRLSAGAERKAAESGDLDRLFTGDESSGTATPASAMREIGDNFARAMTHEGPTPKGGMARVYEQEGERGLRAKLEATRYPARLSPAQVDGVMNYAKKAARRMIGAPGVFGSTSHKKVQVAALDLVKKAPHHPHREIEQFRQLEKQTVEKLKLGGSVSAAQTYARNAADTVKKLEAMDKGGTDIEEHIARALAAQIRGGVKSLISYYTSTPAAKKGAKKSMTDDTHPLPLTTHDSSGRPLSKGLYSFRNAEGDAPMPDEYLYDYLCAFVEEAYEHECREDAHKDLEAGDQLKSISRAIMHEMVQAIPKNPNLMRAARKWSVNVGAVSGILTSKGIHKPSADSTWTDDADSWAAMGAPVGEGLALSLDHVTADFDMHGRPGLELAPRPVEDVATLVMKSEHDDPFADLQARKAAQVRALWGSNGEAAPQKIAADCPVHNGRDMSKAQQLWNPLLPCTCGAHPNPYG